MTTTDIWIALPLLLLSVGALLTLVIGSVTRDEEAGYLVAIAVTIGAALWPLQAPPALLAPTMGLSASGLTRIFTVFFCLMAAGVLVLSKRFNGQRGMCGEEYPATIIFTTFGMVALASSTNLLTLFLGLEAMTFGFYILVAFDLKGEFSGEVGLKYLLMGALSTAFMAFGIALLYCDRGTLDISRVMLSTPLGGHLHPVALAGWGCLLIGIAFKLSLVPAHLWTPDVYQGAPAPVVALLSGGSKGAAILFLLMLLPHTADSALLRVPLWCLALFSMLVGNLAGLLQTRVRRMLAYSSIAQMGYVVMALISSAAGGYQAAAFYTIAYGLMSLAAFGAVAVLEHNGCGATLDDYRGCGARRPFASGVLTLALFSLAGIPPTAGFTGKFLIFASAIKSGEIALAVIGIISAAISIYYYLRVVTHLYFKRADGMTKMNFGSSEMVVLLAVSALIVLLGLFPSHLLELLKPLD